MLAALAVACAAAAWTYLGGAGEDVSPQPPPHENRLGVVDGSVDVALFEPVEFDGMSREEWFEHRRGQVALNPELFVPEYQPSAHLFGQIVDRLPWWGLHGQFCEGPGERSDMGESEESRFLSNPFLLVALVEGTAFRDTPVTCFATWPRPLDLRYSAGAAEVTYDLSRFATERRQAGTRLGRALRLNGINARDWGYRYVAVVDSEQLSPAEGSELLTGRSVELIPFIHAGPSCGQPSGCNNGSPREPNLWFQVDQLPARLVLRLSRGSAPDGDDLRFTIQMR